jgi:hypothetical protein
MLSVGSCEGGCLNGTFERLEPYVGKPTSPVLMGLGYGNVCAMMAWRFLYKHAGWFLIGNCNVAPFDGGDWAEGDRKALPGSDGGVS